MKKYHKTILLIFMTLSFCALGGPYRAKAEELKKGIYSEKEAIQAIGAEAYKAIVEDNNDRIKEGEKYITPEIRDKIKRDKTDLEDIIIANTPALKKEPKEELKGNLQRNDEYRDKQLFVFVSSSMPAEIIRNYIQLTENVRQNTIFVIKGFIGGIKKFKPTFDWVTRTLCDDAPAGSSECLEASIDINPTLFKEFNVDVVPSILYLPEGVKPCACDGSESEPNKPHYLSKGDAPIDYHLTKMAEVESKHRAEIIKFKKRLRKQF